MSKTNKYAFAAMLAVCLLGMNAGFAARADAKANPLTSFALTITSDGNGANSLFGSSLSGTEQVNQGATTSIVYTANQWFFLSSLTSNGVSVVADPTGLLHGYTSYTQTLNGIQGDISNAVSFVRPSWTITQNVGAHGSAVGGNPVTVLNGGYVTNTYIAGNYTGYTNAIFGGALTAIQNIVPKTSSSDTNYPGNGQVHGSCNIGDTYFLSNVAETDEHPARIYRFDSINTNLNNYTSVPVVINGSNTTAIFQMLTDMSNNCLWACTTSPDCLIKVVPSNLAFTVCAPLPSSGKNSTILQDANYVYYGSFANNAITRYSKADYTSNTIAGTTIHHDGVIVPEMDRMIMAGGSANGHFDIVKLSTFTVIQSGAFSVGTPTDDAAWYADETGMYFLFGDEIASSGTYGRMGKIKIANYASGTYTNLATAPITYDTNIHQSWGLFGGGYMSATNDPHNLFNGAPVCAPVFNVHWTNLDVIVFGPGGITYYGYYNIPNTHTAPATDGGASEFFMSSTGQKFYTTFDQQQKAGWSLTEVAFDPWYLTNTISLYQVASVSGAGGIAAGGVGQTNVTIVAGPVTGDIAETVTFSPKTWNVAQYILTPGGTCTPVTVAVLNGGSTQIVYTANDWFRIAALLSNGVPVDAAASNKVFTQTLDQVYADISNHVTFAYLPDAQNGQGVPTTWLASFGQTESTPFFGVPSVQTDYLLNVSPYVTNSYSLVVAGLDVSGTNAVVTIQLLVNGAAAPSINGVLQLYSAGTVSGSWTAVADQVITGANFDGNGKARYNFIVPGAKQFYKVEIQPAE